MTVCACIKFNTPFTEELIPYLDYSANLYKKCKSETFVTGSIFSVMGRFASKELADIFNVDMTDASTWNIPNTFVFDKIKLLNLYSIIQNNIDERKEIFNMLINTPKCRLTFSLDD